MSAANGTTRMLVASADAHADDGAWPGQPMPPRAPAQSLVGGRIGPYLVTKRLGEGGVGEVFKAVDVTLKREVAIKVLRDELAADPHFVERFRREAQLHAKLSHANVAAVHAFLHEGDKQFIVMEFLAGVSLDEFIRSGGPVPVERALHMFRQVLDGIEHAHRCGVIHRDIKPANIMLADGGQVKVMDFGIARALDCQDQLTRHGQVAGTARSMAPEQIRGNPADRRSDIYSLGIVLYTLLAGRPPFDGKTDLELMNAQLEQAPPPLDSQGAHVPPKVEAALLKALHKDPVARFQTVGDFARALDACRAGQGTAPPAADRDESLLSSRTVINPVFAGAQRLPAKGRLRRLAAMRLKPPRWARRAGIAALAVALLGAGLAVLRPHVTMPQALLDPRPMPLPAPAPAAVAPTTTTTPTSALPVEAVAAPAPSPTPAVPDEAPALQRAAIAEPISPVRADTATPLPLTIAVGAATRRFKPGERIRLRVTPSRDSHVYCYLQDEARRVVRFYPNRFSTNALVRADAPLEIPGRMGFELVANARKLTETIACFASERDLAGELPAAVYGSDFATLPVASLDDVSSAFARDAGQGVAQARFRVAFR
jgi:eukaryotic-like serine/threonine-protein kinase